MDWRQRQRPLRALIAGKLARSKTAQPGPAAPEAPACPPASSASDRSTGAIAQPRRAPLSLGGTNHLGYLRFQGLLQHRLHHRANEILVTPPIAP